MKRLTLCLLLALRFLSEKSSAQSSLPEFGVYSAEEINMKNCSFDKDAEAVVLLDEATATGMLNGISIERRLRIKVFDEKAFDRANISIPFISRDEYETIRNIEGAIYDGDRLYYLSDKNIFTEKIDEYLSQKKFTFPNLKVGSIIEYRFEIFRKNSEPDNWYFQTDIPTMNSCCTIKIGANTQFSYVVSKKDEWPMTIKNKEGILYFEMNNIPAFKNEPYMDAATNYLQKVEFQLYSKTYLSGQSEKYRNWKDIVLALASSDGLGEVSKKNLNGTESIRQIADQQATIEGKITLIYNYVRKNFIWNGYSGKYAPDGLNKTWQSKSGTAAEINLLLVKLLRENNIAADPIIVAERNFGKVDPAIPYVDRFNKTMAYVSTGDRIFILDATEKYGSPELVPYSVLNTFGLVIDKKTKEPIKLSSGFGKYRSSIAVQAEINREGLMNGVATISDFEYAKQFKTESIRQDQKRFITTKIENDYDGLTVLRFDVENMEIDSEPLLEKLTFKIDGNESGGYYLINYNFFTGLRKNPFIKTERSTDINFGYPYDLSIETTLNLPANSQIEELPKTKILKTRDNTIFVSREIQKIQNSIRIKIDFVQTLTSVDYEAYASLRDFYKTMVDMLNEPITIKLSK
jgi:hypothetical protein